MAEYGRNKKEKRLLAVIIYLLAIFFMTLESKADMETGYNITVKLDSADTVSLNEKIEVYCEKDGQYYMIIDLNKSNHYEYKKMFENGVYTFQARVRYDMNEEYTIFPNMQMIKLTYKNNNILNEVVFTIGEKSGEAITDSELHSHLTDESEQELEDNIQAEKVYTIDDIVKLYEIQESIVADAESAFTEQEIWEQNNNFASKYGISDQKIGGMEDGLLPMHVYPEPSGESAEIDENFMESESSISLSEGVTESKSKFFIESKEPIIFIMAILVFLVVCLGIIIYLWKKRSE